METSWFMSVAVMVAAYVVLDGFDLGAGAIYLAAGKTSDERRKILRAIGPVWDGNEVWLLAAGGTLYFAFPLLYASSFSGFYLPLMMVLWLLMLRGIGIELRAHRQNPVWVGFFDLIFCVSSVLGGGVCPVSRRIAGQHECCLQLDHLQHRRRTARADGRLHTVGSGNDSGRGILRLAVPHVSREGTAGRGRVLSGLHPKSETRN
jgi:hypothetical protein